MTDHDVPDCCATPDLVSFVSYPLDGIHHTVYRMSDGTVRKTSEPIPESPGPFVVPDTWQPVGYTTDDAAAREAGFKR